MECSCSCGYDGDYEPVEMFNDLRPRARVSHRCCECRETIEPGTVYARQTYLFEGRWWADCRCLPCNSIRENYAPCASPGEMAEMVYECLGFWIFAPVDEIEEDWEDDDY